MKVTPNSDTTGLQTLDIIGKADRFNHWMYSAIRPFCQGKILEIGSGVGNISSYFIGDGLNIHLSDIRQEYCEFLQFKFAGSPHLIGINQLDLIHANFTISYAHLLEKFDTVFFLNVLEHIYDHGLAVANAQKLLKPGGKLIILVPAYPILFCHIDEGLVHYRRYTAGTLKKVLLENNYKLLKVFHFNAVGIFAWLIAGKILQKKNIEEGKMSLFNRFVPVFKFFDWISFRKIGLSLIIVASKPIE
jgi:SAM-dependent methyltransferase